MNRFRKCAYAVALTTALAPMTLLAQGAWPPAPGGGYLPPGSPTMPPPPSGGGTWPPPPGGGAWPPPPGGGTWPPPPGGGGTWPPPPGGGGGGGGSDNLPVTNETDSALPDHTIVHLTTMSGAVPIVLWENGACSRDVSQALPFLRGLANAGYIVFANGTVGGSGSGSGTDASASVDLMEAALNWAIAENSRSGSKYQGKLDTNRIAAMGYSCGGFASLETAAVDNRIDSLLIFNSSTNPQDSDSQASATLSGIRAGVPLGIVNGGTGDMAYDGAVRDWGLIPRWMPAIFANFEGVGHTSFWTGSTYRPTLIEIADNWLKYTLVDGNATSQGYFLNNPCGFCDDSSITIERKNWSAFDPQQWSQP